MLTNIHLVTNIYLCIICIHIYKRDVTPSSKGKQELVGLIERDLT